MYPLTEEEYFLNLLGKTLLHHQIIVALKSGLENFVIVGNPTNIKRIEEITSSIIGIRVETAIQEKSLGIASALKAASKYLDDEIIVVNPSEIFYETAYTALLLEKSLSSAESYLLGYRVNQYFPGDYLVVENGDYLKSILEEPKKGEEPSDMVNVFVHMHTDPKKLLEYVTKVEAESHNSYKRTLGSMIKEGHKIKVLPLPGLWNTIKYPWHILEVVRRFFTQFESYIASTAKISEKAVIKGKVIISDRVEVMENAVVHGPAYIGPGTTIGTNCLVSDNSHIGANCNLGYATMIENSYIGDNNEFFMNYIGDSIIGEHCKFGAGTKTANYYTDGGNVKVRIGGSKVDTGHEKFGTIAGNNCRFGINSSIMPGVKIAPGSVINSHICVKRDVLKNVLA
jgi:bifunctional UDP-N-acetylglucosamine pyrophosphorylase/glucosamine-1-phosphate N-acetyltransferase